MNVTLSLHAELSLSRDCHFKTHVYQRLFPFSYSSKKGSRHAQHVTLFPRISMLKLLQSTDLVGKAES